MNLVYEYNAGSTGTAYHYGINRTHSSSGSYYLYNGHGDVVQLMSSAGAVTKSYAYDAFGNEKNPSSSDTNPFRYCGEYFDTESGTIYLRARYYNPANGRFTQQDSWGYANPSDPLSLNLYTYCQNNPVLYVDVSGNSITLAVILAVGAFALVSGAIDATTQLIANEGDFDALDWRSIGASSAAGLVTGAMGVATGGLSLGFTGTVAAGALISGVGYGTYNLVNGTETTALGWTSSMVTGGVFSGVGYKITHVSSEYVSPYRYKVNYNKKYAKASYIERKFTKSTNISNLYGNSDDPFFKVAPSDTAIKKHMTYITYNGTIEEPILVRKLASGGYEIVNGHHRWAAAIKKGLKNIPIEIENYKY